MLYNIQVLRAIAALLVVHTHAAGTAGFNLAWDGGANGVDLFFVISGFIIAYVASIESDQFMMRRLVRIVPIYWSSTIALYLLVVLAPNLFRTASSDPELFVRSLLFLPTGSAVHTSDGIPHPTLAGGWTLNYEMYFYVVFAIALAVSKKWATTIATIAIMGIVAVIDVTGLGDNPVAHFYGYPIVFEFVFGMLAFHVCRHIESGAALRRPPEWQKWALLAIIVAGFVLLAFSEAIFGEAPRWIVSGIPSFFILVSAVVLERVHGWKITNKWAVLVGDASYVLYLIQAYVVYGVIRLTLKGVEFNELTGQLMSLVLMAISVVASILVYRLYEQPILRFLKKRLIRSKPRTIGAVAVTPPP